ncbi:MAG: glycosyltransferase family 39 protein [Solirubrobacterales bacterium]
MRATGTSRLAPFAWVAAGALALRLAFGNGFANYDSFYALVWGSELAHGQSADYSAALPPTPHPLATLFGAVVSPLGDGAEAAMVVVAFLSLAALAYLVYRLGDLWLNRWVGLAAAAIVLTRVPVLDYGVRAYVDIPYIALVLAALLVETRRPRAGWPVLALLGVAGLLRPEAWLFSAAYLAYLAWPDRRLPDLRLIALAAAAPLAWAAFDLAVTGDPLYSLTGTKDTVGTLHRDTGLFDALRLAPRRLGEILREPVLLGAAGGLVFGLALFRRRVAIGAAATALALGAFLLLATAGLAVITRYLLLTGALLAIFAAAGVLGWLSLERENPWRLRWAAFAGVVVVATLAFGPQQAKRLRDLRERVADQERIRDQLHEVTDEPGFDRDCSRIALPSTQGVPLLALWLDLRPSEISTLPVAPRPDGYLIEPANREVAELFALDRHDPRSRFVPPIRLATTAANSSWLVFGRCGTAPAPGPTRRAG